MGKYLNEIKGTPLPTRGKAAAILELLPEAKEIPEPVQWVEGIVCVVENRTYFANFDAAGYAYDAQELMEFQKPHDTRKKTWLIVPNAKNYVN